MNKKNLEVILSDGIPNIKGGSRPALILFHKDPRISLIVDKLAVTIIDIIIYQYKLPPEYKSTVEIPYMYYISKDNEAELIIINKTEDVSSAILRCVSSKVTPEDNWKDFTPFI
jgi:hypothetical protein